MTRMGEREIELDSIIHFPRGLVGLEDKRQFVLLQVKEDSPFLLLQCVHDPGLGLLVADPFSFIKDYDVKLERPERKILKVENIRQMAILVTVTIPRDKPEDLTLNLQGPIVINTQVRLGLQVPQMDGGYPTHFRPINS